MVYLHNYLYAKEHNEEKLYSESKDENINCVTRLKATADIYLSEGRLDVFLQDMIDMHGIERVIYVLAKLSDNDSELCKVLEFTEPLPDCDINRIIVGIMLERFLVMYPDAVFEMKEMARRALFLEKEHAIGIFLIKEGSETRDIRFVDLDYVTRKGGYPKKSDYYFVYCYEGNEGLHDVYERFNMRHPDDYFVRSVSVSDVIVVKDGDNISSYYVDSIGFKKLENFF